MICTIVPEAALEAGQMLYFQEENRPHLWEGRLLEITEDKLLVSICLASDSSSHDISPRTRLRCSAPLENCTYRFSAAFCGNAPLDGRIWYVEKPTTIVCQQRRSWRVPVTLPINLQPKEQEAFPVLPQKATLVDIGGHGLCLVSPIPFPEGMRLSIEIPALPWESKQAVVRRSAALNSLAGPIHHIGALLEQPLSRQEQEELLHHVHSLQKEYPI